MPTVRKLKSTSRAFNSDQVDAAVAAASPTESSTGIDWKRGVVTNGGGVAETIAALKRTRGKNKNPTKQQVAIRIDHEVLTEFRAGGPGWQTRINDVLRRWVERHRKSAESRIPHVAVEPRPNGRWAVQTDGAQHADSLHDRKSDAITRARELAEHKNTEVVIKNADGRIAHKDSRGDDLRQAKGIARRGART